MEKLRLNILDQSPVMEGGSAASAVKATVELADAADRLGYFRYWVAEHHNTQSFATASPEIMIARLGAATRRIRIGSGGVLLGHYSPYKVAEQFRMLEALFPGRVDLGIGRAPGGDARVVRALESDLLSGRDSFSMIPEVLAYLEVSRPSPRRIKAMPEIDGAPEVWMLGSSPQSAAVAASLGLPYIYGTFISDDNTIPALRTYFQEFQPDGVLSEPRTALAVFGICAESEKEARRLSGSSETWFVQSLIRRQNVPFPPANARDSLTLHPSEQLILSRRRASAIIGNPRQVSEQLHELADRFRVAELTLVTITDSYESRLASYTLLGETFLNA